jgi:tetratricopeptide (TPR) repeat protein
MNEGAQNRVLESVADQLADMLIQDPPVDLSREATADAAGKTSVFSNLPERNPFFTGRERVLEQLQETLATQKRAAVSGLGGGGKTQTAVEYAYKHLEQYVYTFWANAASRETIISSYIAIAKLLKLPLATVQDQTIIVDAIQHWLNSHEKWLLILDNADDLAMAREFITTASRGHLILTTRVRATGLLAPRIDIREMGIDEGSLLLLRRAQYIAHDALLNEAVQADQDKAKNIATQLDGLPLALDQAGAYIEETGCGLSSYLDLYRKRASELLRERGTLNSGHPDPVASTWALSFENIEQVNPVAAELLKFCAFLDPEAIPEEVFREGAPDLGPVLGSVGLDELALNRAVAEILKYSLLRRDPNSQTLGMHRLVQTVLKQGMNQDMQRRWAERAVRAVNRAFPRVEFSTWPCCERLLPQAHACADLIKEWDFELSEAGRLLNRAGIYSFERGQYDNAELLYQQALEIRQKALGPEHSDLAYSLNCLAGLFRKTGRYAKAEQLYLRSLTIQQQALGTGHPDVAHTLNELARLYHRKGDYAKAEEVCLRALKISEQASDPVHSWLAESLNNLAGIYDDLGRRAAAEALCQRALTVWEQILGPADPHMAASLNNLALVHYNQGRYTQAELLYKRALTIWEQTLGPEHPDVAHTVCSLALLYYNQGRNIEADPLYQRALAIREKALGPEHPNVAKSLNNLAGLYDAQGRYASAEPLYERALAIREKALGPEHPDVATSLHNLAGLYCNQGWQAKAEPLYQRALAIWEKALGPEHPELTTFLESYALLLQRSGRPEEAQPLETRARALRSKHG